MGLSEQLGEYFGVERGRGVLVTSVEKNSAAEKAGIKAGDVIIKADNQRIFEYEDLRDVIGDFEEGDKIAVVVIRDKKEQSFEVTVEKRKGYRHGRSYHYSGPDFDIRIPDMDDVYFGIYSDDGEEYFDSEEWEEYHEAMEEFREEMEDLREEFREMHLEKNEELRELQQEAREELKDEIRDLQRELRDMSRKLD
jgi:hypothetical protein